MKKQLFFLLIAVTMCFVSKAQEVRTNKQNSFLNTKYATDVIIKSEPSINQQNVKLAVAFNGWLYAAYSKVDSLNNTGGITIMASRDNGFSWTTITSYSPVNIRYPAIDIVVTGTDTNNLFLYLLAVHKNINNYTIFIDKYNATTNTFIGAVFNESKGTRKVYDVAMATDYRFPAVNANPYSIAFVYSVSGIPYDSLNYVASIDAGATWSVNHNIFCAGYFLRKVSLAYGRSASGSNGRYFAAWEQLSSSTARTGHIYTSRSISTIDGAWITPINLDSISSTMINLCRNPSIAVQFNTVDNDSAGTTAVVLVDRDYAGDGSDYDVLGFYNKRAHFTNYWKRLDIINNSTSDMFPDITYDPGNDNFLAVYFDSTNRKLPYVINGMNLATPSTWQTINSQYNDNSNLSFPYPKVEINPVLNQVAHVWIADGSGNKGVAMFDAEYYTGVGIENNLSINTSFNLQPNPANKFVNIQFKADGNTNVKICIYDIYGKLIKQQIAQNIQGENYNEIIDVSDLNNGIYLISIESSHNNISKRFVVSH